MGEDIRQVWHAFMGTLIAAIIYCWNIRVTQAFFIALLFGLFFVRYLASRNYDTPFLKDYLKVLTSKGRGKEMGDGAMFFIMGALISILFFPKNVAAISVLVLGISDALATIVGRRSKHYIYGKKTLEGSSAFFLSAFLIIGLAYNFIIGLIVGLILTAIELFAGFDDNATIPPTGSLLISLLKNIIVG